MRIVRQSARNLKHDASAVLIARCDTTIGRHAVASMVAFEDAAALLRYPTGFAIVISAADGAQYIARQGDFLKVLAFVADLSDSVELWLRGLDDSEEHSIRLLVNTINAAPRRQEAA